MTPSELYQAAAAELQEAQRRLGQTPRADPDARAVAARKVEELVARVRALKLARKAANVAAAAAPALAKEEAALRNFAGLGNSPFYLVCKERLPAEQLAEIESAALAMQRERLQAAVERKAKREPPPEPPSPKPLVLPERARGALRAAPEIIRVAPRAAPEETGEHPTLVDRHEARAVRGGDRRSDQSDSGPVGRGRDVDSMFRGGGRP